MYALIQDNTVQTYPYWIAQLRKDHPNTSFPKNPNEELLAEYGVVRVYPTDRPEVDHTQNVNEGNPSQIDGKWVQMWVISDATAEEIEQRTETQAQTVRAQRDALLAQSDWTQGKDIPDNISQPWAAYRQALRDIPEQPSFPWAVEWPTKPE
jgi:hypothetical protein